MSRFRARDAAAAATAAMMAGASGLWTVTLRQWGSSKELYQESVYEEELKACVYLPVRNEECV